MKAKRVKTPSSCRMYAACEHLVSLDIGASLDLRAIVFIAKVLLTSVRFFCIFPLNGHAFETTISIFSNKIRTSL